MAKKCSICEAEIKFLDPKLSLKDGLLDKNCSEKIGLNPDKFGDMVWAEEHNVDDVQSLINQNIKLDLKDEKAKLKEKKQAEKSEKQIKKAELRAKKFKQKQKEKAEKLQKIANSEGGELNIKVVLDRFQKHHFSKTDKLMADFDDKKLYIKKSFLQPAELIDFDNIISYTPIENGQHISKHHRITRGIAGGLLAGGIGAGIGAATGGKDFDQIDELSIIINFIHGRTRKITLGKSLKAGSLSAKFSIKEYQENLNLLENILNTKKQQHSTAPVDNHMDKKIEQLSKLKQLFDDNVITEEEFKREKNKLLQN